MTTLRVLFVSAGFVLFCGCKAKKELAAEKLRVEEMTTKSAELQAKNEELEKNVSSLKQQVSDASAKNTAMSDEFAKYKSNCEITQRKYAATAAVLREEEERLMELEKKLDAALADFHDKGVDVYYKQGYLHVSLPDDLMYKSGSSKLDVKGKEALSKLVPVLNDYPNLKIVVLGNTDDAQFKKGASDNWSLSTERANGVVRVLRDEYKVDPMRMTAAGKAKYNPVADNSTKEGRAKNRRTDIILNPDFEKLWQSTLKDN